MMLYDGGHEEYDKAIKSLEERENENRIDNDDNNDME